MGPWSFLGWPSLFRPLHKNCNKIKWAQFSATFLQVTFRSAFCSSPACQISDSTTNSIEGITRQRVDELCSLSQDKKIRLCCSVSQSVPETAVLVTPLSWWICVCRPNWHTDKPGAVFLPSAVICGEHPAAPVHSIQPVSRHLPLQNSICNCDSNRTKQLDLQDLFQCIVELLRLLTYCGIARTHCVFVPIDLPDASSCKNKTKSNFIFNLKQASSIIPPSSIGLIISLVTTLVCSWPHLTTFC